MTAGKKIDKSDLDLLNENQKNLSEVAIKLMCLPDYELVDGVQEMLSKTVPNYTEEEKRAYLVGFQFGFGLVKVDIANWSFIRRLKFLLWGV